MRDFANLRLGHSAQWHQRAARLRLAQTEKEIRLILSLIDALAQHGECRCGALAALHTMRRRRRSHMLNNRVVTGRDVIAAESLRLAPEVAELELLIAHHARVRRSACLILAGAIVYYDALALIGLVAHVMRNAERMGYAERVRHGPWPGT